MIRITIREIVIELDEMKEPDRDQELNTTQEISEKTETIATPVKKTYKKKIAPIAADDVSAVSGKKHNFQKNQEPYNKEETKARKRILMQRYLLKKKGELTKVENDKLDKLLAEIDEKKRATYEFK